MRVAVPISGEWVSPTLDQADRLLVAELVGGRYRGRVGLPLLGRTAVEQASELTSLGVNTLLCGAVSSALARAIEARGIDVRPVFTGQAEVALWTFANGALDDRRLEKAVPGWSPQCPVVRHAGLWSPPA